LRDYLRVLRQHRWLILGVALAFAAAAFLVSSLQKKEYTAETDLLFRDVSQDLALVGQNSIPELAPDQRAAINADRVTRPDVVDKVRRSLNTDLTTAELKDEVSTQVGSRTNFVIVQVTDSNKDFAARVANAFGTEVQKLDSAEIHRRIDSVVAELRSNLAQVKKSRDETAGTTLSVLESQIAQLQAVKQLARPVEIARAATPPSSPSSPKTARNTILGAIVGLAFGLLAAFLRDSLDRRLRNSDEVQAELHLPVIGRVPDEALGHAGFANGAVDDADIESHLEAFRMLRTNLEFLQAGTPMKTVMVTSGLPEEGKSSVALALAGAAAVAGKRTLLVECDLRRPCLADRLGIDEEPGLTDYLLGEARPADILQVVKLGGAPSANGTEAGKSEDELASMVCITAGSTAQLPAEMLGSERFSSFLTKVSKAYDIVVLDTSPILSVVDALELAPQVDGLLFCVRLSKTTRDEAKAAREALGHLPGRPTGVVVTGYRPGDDSYYGYAYGGYSSSE
jgi:Mrp family chromosome partitioning ATPase/capsular polysaccharide biosynthesis protein